MKHKEKCSRPQSPTAAELHAQLALMDWDDLYKTLLDERPFAVRTAYWGVGAPLAPFASAKRFKTESAVTRHSQVAGLPADWVREDRIAPGGKAHLVVLAPNGAVYPSLAQAKAAAASLAA